MATLLLISEFFFIEKKLGGDLIELTSKDMMRRQRSLFSAFRHLLFINIVVVVVVVVVVTVDGHRINNIYLLFLSKDVILFQYQESIL